MTYVVAEPCIGVKDHACMNVCPVDCFYEAEDQLVINPDECIDCGACVPECPVEAIFPEEDLPEKWASYTEKNARPFQEGQELPTAPYREEWEAERAKPGSTAAGYYEKYSPLT
ncbi:MAG: ferredoxin family protein [Armatimonadetes bacterium]|nr:ferredoxin family protein [Armatimonadota bacterium]